MTSILQQLREIVGTAHVFTEEADTAAYLSDQHRRVHGLALAVVRPADTEQVAAVVRLCRSHGVPIVPQGGNTGLVAGATPDRSGQAVLLSLKRLQRIRAVDTDNDTITLEAGTVLAAAQQAANEHGRLLPLSLGSEGSCTIGGNLSTNAGGTQVLRYGNTRELALGLEVVTAEGEIWDGLKGLRKDNTGYALRDLYIGSEGTLGIITAATLKLYPQPAAQHTAYVAFASIENALVFLSRARLAFGAELTAFEILSRNILNLVAQHVPQQPLAIDHQSAPWFALIELSTATPPASSADDASAQVLEATLHKALEDGVLSDAVIASSLQQREGLWGLRDKALSEAQRRDGTNIKHDVSVPISRIPAFLEHTAQALEQHFPGVRPMPFGHLGDGNLHYNVSHAPGSDLAKFFAQEDAIHAVVHDSVHAHGGSISAEHGIGYSKQALLPHYKSAVEMDLMRRIKNALDPLGLLNPGKILSPSAGTAP